MIDQLIELDPDKIFEAINSRRDVLGISHQQWKIIIRDAAQEIANEASAQQYDQWNIEDLGYDY